MAQPLTDETVNDTPSARAPHLRCLLEHPWMGTWPQDPRLTESAVLAPNTGNMYSCEPCSRFPPDTSLKAMRVSIPIALEVTAAFELALCMSGCEMMSSHVMHDWELVCTASPRPCLRTSFAGELAKDGAGTASSALSPASKLVAYANSFIRLVAPGIVCSPLLANLIGCAAHFGDEAENFVKKFHRLPSIGVLQGSAAPTPCMLAFEAASTAGAYLLPDSEDSESEMFPSAVGDCSDALWKNPLLRFMPLAPFCTREAGMHYSCIAIKHRRNKVSAISPSSGPLWVPVCLVVPRPCAGQGLP
jgi:hypothetical protein